MKSKIVSLLLLCTFLVSGCEAQKKEEPAKETTIVVETEEVAETEAAETEAAETEEAAAGVVVAGAKIGETVSVAGWNITAEDVQFSDELENVAVELGYTGVATSTFSKEAEDGMQFCLIKMMFEKSGSKENIEWEKLVITDAQGNTYQRMEDEFINDLGMMRMAGTTLNFGKNEGWIAFEIPADAAGVTLNYDFAEENYCCALN